MLTQSAIQSFFHADYSGTNQLLKQILEPIFGDYELGFDEITRSQTIKEKAKTAHIKTIKHAATFDAEGLQIKLFDVTLDNQYLIESGKVALYTANGTLISHVVLDRSTIEAAAKNPVRLNIPLGSTAVANGDRLYLQFIDVYFSLINNKSFFNYLTF